MTSRMVVECEVIETLLSYADALDHRDWSLLAELFAEDAQARWMSRSEGQEGRDEIVDYIRGRFTEFSATHHQFGNFRIEVNEEAETASFTFRCRNYHAYSGAKAGQFMETLGRFEGSLVFRRGRWAIREWNLVPHDIVYGMRALGDGS